MLHILNVTAETTKPLNILADGTMDPTKTMWVFGGTTYRIACATDLGEYHPDTHFSINVQLENDVWFCPAYQYFDKNIHSLLKRVRAMDLEYEAHILSHR